MEKIGAKSTSLHEMDLSKVVLLSLSKKWL